MLRRSASMLAAMVNEGGGREGGGRRGGRAFDFGISGYRPDWLQGSNPIVATHGRRLSGLVGRALRHVWLVWDLRADEWFCDCPVLLDFGDEQVEVNHQKFDDVSVTFSSIDPGQSVAWPTSDDFPLAWRAEPIEQLDEFRGQMLRQVELLEYTGGTLADGSVALGFAFPAGHLTIYNALDENGLLFGAPGRDWRKHIL
ncbi:hypothetical protein O7633_31365 [Micromonospora sp. WMMD712]|nr:hypothetical protein O7633_31365 [Micromonospora sp. WMMD712]